MNRDLQYGSIGMDVRELQLGLNELGYSDMMGTGFFGSKTESAVRQFQLRNSITPSLGYFGSKTRPLFEQQLSTCRAHRNHVFQTAIDNLGKDVTPMDIIPDEYDCADTVCTILQLAGFSIGNLPLTTDLYKYLQRSSEWTKVYSPLEGDVIISPTGYGNGVLSNGHVGIMGLGGSIMSNNSYTGLFTQNYTLKSWRARYGVLGGFPVVFFRKL